MNFKEFNSFRYVLGPWVIIGQQQNQNVLNFSLQFFDYASETAGIGQIFLQTFLNSFKCSPSLG